MTSTSCIGDILDMFNLNDGLIFFAAAQLLQKNTTSSKSSQKWPINITHHNTIAKVQLNH